MGVLSQVDCNGHRDSSTYWHSLAKVLQVHQALIHACVHEMQGNHDRWNARRPCVGGSGETRKQ